MPIFIEREGLGALLEREGLRSGVELGVQRGQYAQTLLSTWPSNRRYVLVDLWAPLDAYHDLANVDQAAQDAIMSEALANVAPWSDKVAVCRNFTISCALSFKDGEFDFVYVDARHDRWGVTQDLTAWWPKVRPGGLVCGHDFVTQAEGPAQSGQRWDLNGDGSVDPTGGAVRAAVEDFAAAVTRQIQVGYQQKWIGGSGWWTWCVRR